MEKLKDYTNMLLNIKNKIKEFYDKFKFWIGYLLRKKKQFKTLLNTVLSNRQNFTEIELDKQSLIEKFYFKMKFYYYNNKKKENTKIDNIIDKYNVHFIMKINKQFLKLRKRRSKFFRGHRVPHYVSEMQAPERLWFFFSKRNRLRWYGLQFMFGEWDLPIFTPASKDENIHFGSLKTVEQWRRTRRYITYANLKKTDLIGWLKNKFFNTFGFFYNNGNKLTSLQNENTEESINYVYKPEFKKKKKNIHSELYSEFLEANDPSKFITKYEKFMFFRAEFYMKIKRSFSGEEIQKKKREKNIEYITRVYTMLENMKYKKNREFFYTDPYFVENFIEYFVKNFLKDFNVEKDNVEKDNVEKDNVSFFSKLYEKTNIIFNKLEDYLKLLTTSWKKDNWAYNYKKEDLPTIYLLVDSLIILKNDANVSGLIGKISENILEPLLRLNSNLFEYLLFLGYLLFFIALVNAILKLISNIILNFDLERFKSFFVRKKKYKNKIRHFDFYEYYNRMFSSFYKKKNSTDFESIEFFKQLTIANFKNNEKISKVNDLFLKFKKTQSIQNKNENNLSALNNHLNTYSMLTEISMTKNFTYHLVNLISKQKSQFFTNLAKTLNLKQAKDYYMWDYFNKHLFDEMYYNIVLKEASFNTMLSKNKKENLGELSNSLHINPLNYKEIMNMNISKKNWVFKYDSTLHNVEIINKMRKTNNENFYTRDWYRSRTNFFSLPTSKIYLKSEEASSFRFKQMITDLWYLLEPVFMNIYKILFAILFFYVVVFTTWSSTLLLFLTLFIIYYVLRISVIGKFLKYFKNFPIIKVLLFFIGLSSLILCLYVIYYIISNIFAYILYNIYGIVLDDYLNIINSKNIYMQSVIEYLKINHVFVWIMKIGKLSEVRKDLAKFYNFSNLKVLLKEFYFFGFKDWPNRRKILDHIYPYFRRWYYDIKTEKKDEPKEMTDKRRAKQLEKAFRTLSYTKDTFSLRAIFDFSVPKEKFYKYVRDKYFEITLAKAHLGLWFIQNYNQTLVKFSELMHIYESYLFKHLQKTNFISSIQFKSKKKIYISKIHWFFYFNRKINVFLIYIFLGIIIHLLIFSIYYYTKLKVYMHLMSSGSVVKKLYKFTLLRELDTTKPYNNNYIVKTFYNINFVKKVRYFTLKQQLKVLEETSKLKFIDKINKSK